ncbi:MAG TPA: glycosyltransferase [Chitinophagaceae bacterium]|nr:glycosyltransferase [Chitinophagaceae bacterium]
MSQSGTPIKVSVLVMTYNHVQFIAKAVESALMQQTDFNFEILISEDCSTDGTREIVMDYQRNHPDKISLLLSKQNIRSNAVVTRGIYAAKGDYIALLDGDDFWTSPFKLQKQAAFLDAHGECSMCFHNACTFTEDGEQKFNWTSEHQKQFSSLDDLWMGNVIATCTTMFRNRVLAIIPKWYDSFFPITDWPLYILLAQHGNIGFLNENMGAYRLHAGGLYSPYSEKEKQKKTLDFYKRINRYLNYRYDKPIREAISVFFYDWAKEYKKRGELKRAIECFNTSLQGKPFNKLIAGQTFVKFGCKLYMLYFSERFRKKKKAPSTL